MRKRPLLMAACVFLTGICFKTYGGILWICIQGILLVYAVWPSMKEKQTKKVLILCAIFCLFFLAGLQKTSWEEDFKNRYLSELQDGETLTIQGEIYYKEQKTYQIYYYLKNTYIQSKNQAVPCNQVIAYMSQDLFPIGTTIIANGTVSFFQKARNEGNFDTRAFYATQKIDFALEELSVEKSILPALSWKEWLYQLRCRLKTIIMDAMGEKEGGVLTGMLLGDKSSLDQEVKETYKDAGISHALAISALHLSIFASGIYGFLRKRGMSYLGTGFFSLAFLMGYATMTGNGVSTQRAAGMFLITIIGAVFGRSSDLLNSLGAVVLYLLWENPGLIDYGGFQFSIVAVMSIGIVNEVRWKREMIGHLAGIETEKGFGKKKESGGEERVRSFKKQFLESFLLSGFIQLATLPLTAYHYFELPIYAVVLNVILLPFMAYLLPLGALGAICGLFLELPAKLILLPCRVILWFYEKSCSLMLHFPFSQWITGQPEVWESLVYYVVLFIGVVLWYTGKKKRWICLADGFAVVFCLFGISSISPQISVLDVGQGDGIFIQSQSGISMFIDGGSSDVKQVGTYRILPFLKSKGVQKIDYWFVSHGDNDHISGLTEVLESGYSVENLVFSSAIPRDDAWERLFLLAGESGSKILYLDQGDCLVMGQETMTCLFPRSSTSSADIGNGEDSGESGENGAGSDSAESGDRNALSMVLLWKSGDFSGIFTGDISETEENLILDQCSIEEVDFYKAAHHGSNSSNSSEFLENLCPDIAVVSCGEDNSYGHPGKEAVLHMEKAGCKVFYTMESGQITVEIGQTIDIWSWLSHN